MANQEQAQQEMESEKKHGDKLEGALKKMDGHGAGAAEDPVPLPESGGHERSHAAHLGEHVHEHTKPAGDQRGLIEEHEFQAGLHRTGQKR